MDRKKRILAKSILLAQNLWIATPTSRLAMTESRRHCEGAKRPKQSTAQKADSRKTSKATILNKQLGGRILRLESGLCKASAEIRLGCLSHKRAAAIHDSSPKQAKRSFFRKANAQTKKSRIHQNAKN